MSEESASARAVPYHCPYCAETDLWPHEPSGWECRGCQRAFQVQLIAYRAGSSTAPSTTKEVPK
ncbi:hypothetical protein [Nocardioides sp.]|uniref:hypothetical protein n=1 Tax=Nocardioides sp. TaxID=35761 RepID=UPI0035163D9A